MAKAYTGKIITADAPSAGDPLGWVPPGSFVVLRVRALSGATRDAYGRWPHLLYIPGENAMGASACATYRTNIENPRDVIQYEDDGQCFYAPLAGSLYVTGGAGDFTITTRIDRQADRIVDVVAGAALQNLQHKLATAGPGAGFWKLTSYSLDNIRRTGIPVPLGARSATVSTTSDLEITNNLAAAEAVVNVDPTAEVPIDFATSIAFVPRGSGGYLVLHGGF